MALNNRVVGFLVMGTIVAFAIIHLGVSIGIIVPQRKYNDVFRPQVGLSSFNLVIALLGLVTGILGLISLSTRSAGLGKILAILSGILGIFALASLIAALVINSKSNDYVSARFKGHMSRYASNGDSRTIVDRIQTKHKCCGENMWLDWGRIGLNANITKATEMTTATTTMMMTTTTTTTTIMMMSTTTTTPRVETTSITETTEISPENSTEPPAAKKRRRSIEYDQTYSLQRLVRLAGKQMNFWFRSSRKKRQAAITYGGINDLPLSFGVVLPRSCCSSEAILLNNQTDSYCVSNANGGPNHFYQKGCSKSLDFTAGNQAMGIGIINSCMVVLGFVGVPILFNIPTE